MKEKQLELFSFDDEISLFELIGNEFLPDEYYEIEGSISNHRLQYVINMHSTDITGLLKKLCTTGYLESDNNGRWTIYKLKTKVDTLPAEVSSSLKLVENKDKTGMEVDTSGRKVDTPGRKVDTSERKVDTSAKKVDTSDNIGTTRLNKEELELLIMQVCKTNYIKMEEVANRIGKSVDYLKNKIFPALIKDGKLEKKFPYTHNHPDQGYKTSEDYAKEL
jgi:ATP-dependent DNA helicase RecG